MDPAFQQGDTKIGGYVMISGVFYWSFSGTASEVGTACTDIVADNLRPFMFAISCDDRSFLQVGIAPFSCCRKLIPQIISCC